MESLHPGRAVSAAVLVALAATAAGGNQWSVRKIDEFNEPGGRALLSHLAPFRWRVSDFPGSAAMKFSPYAGIIVFVALLVLLVLPVARRASGPALWIGVVGATLFATFISIGVVSFVNYGALFGSAGGPVRANRLTWAGIEASASSGSFALVVGLLGGGLAALVGGRRVSVAPAPSDPDGTWGGQVYRGPNDTQAMWVPTQAGHGWTPPPPPSADYAWTESEQAASFDHYGLADETTVQEIQPKPDR
ncbi:MAG TPA: hypothetical protein PKV27_01520 [Ilumatobacteraceae bacterium]|nr:hypothetical protein [Ilumatobacteraceae bacterium]